MILDTGNWKEIPDSHVSSSFKPALVRLDLGITPPPLPILCSSFLAPSGVIRSGPGFQVSSFIPKTPSGLEIDLDDKNQDLFPEAYSR